MFLFQIESFLKNNIAAVVPSVINKIYAVLKLVSSRCFKLKEIRANVVIQRS